MDTNAVLQSAVELIKPWIIEKHTPEVNRLDVTIPTTNLFAVVSALVKAHWGYLSAITGLDHPAPAAVPQTPAGESPKPANSIEPTTGPKVEADGILEALYHFCQGAAVFTLRVSIPYQNPILPSICGIIPSATLYERELMEMFGIEILGSPNKDRLLLSDDWPQGVFPMRKAFTGFDIEHDPASEPQSTTAPSKA